VCPPQDSKCRMDDAPLGDVRHTLVSVEEDL